MTANAALTIPRLKASARFGSVTVFDDVVDVRRDWDRLVAQVPCSPYQTPAWLVPWSETLGIIYKLRLAVGYDTAGSAVALLPLGLRRRAGLAVASFLGGSDANTGLGLFDSAFAWDAATLQDFLHRVAHQGGIDCFVLRNQPYAWQGQANPLIALPHDRSASLQHEADLHGSAERFFAATLSKRARKHIRQKEAKLAALGPVRHEVAATPASTHAIVDALLTHHAERFGMSKSRDEALRRFLLVAGTPSGKGAVPVVELHALFCNDTIVSAFAGAAHNGRFSGMMTVFDPDPRWARCSPGELLIARVVAAKCTAGFDVIDLGIGEARYKDGFCPRAEPLFDTILGFTHRGRLMAHILRVQLRLKRKIKRTPWLLGALQRGQRAARLR